MFKFIIAVSVVLVSQISFAQSNSRDYYCRSMSEAVQVMAQSRDAGASKDAVLDVIVSASDTDEVNEPFIVMADLVYNNQDISPDMLMVNYYLKCLEGEYE